MWAPGRDAEATPEQVGGFSCVQSFSQEQPGPPGLPQSKANALPPAAPPGRFAAEGLPPRPLKLKVPAPGATASDDEQGASSGRWGIPVFRGDSLPLSPPQLKRKRSFAAAAAALLLAALLLLAAARSPRFDVQQQRRLRVLQGRWAGSPIEGSSGIIALHAVPDRLPGGWWEHEACGNGGGSGSAHFDAGAALVNGSGAASTHAAFYPASTHAQQQIQELVEAGVWEPRRDPATPAAWCTAERSPGAPLPQLRGVAVLHSGKPPQAPGLTLVAHASVDDLGALERLCRRAQCAGWLVGAHSLSPRCCLMLI